jgi:glycosyltransferase involved in cell wall biosynthesis
MKIAFVTPRYGEKVVGGAEYAVRMFAERLVRAGDDVTVYTSCAEDSRTWQSVYEIGEETINDVLIRRFECDQRSKNFEKFSESIRENLGAVSVDDHNEWLREQGPFSDELAKAAANADADVLIGYPYLYQPVIDAITQTELPTVLHPAAHNEWMLQLPRNRELFDSALGLVFQTDAERKLCEQMFSIQQKHQIRLGLGVEPREVTNSEVIEVRESFGIGDKPYLLYLGRVDNGKGVDALVEFFSMYKKRKPGDLQLVLAGPVLDRQKEHPDVHSLGAVSELNKWALLSDAIAVSSASAWEAFGLILLEAWSAHTPVLVNEWCSAFAELVSRAQGGFSFGGYADFEAQLDRLLRDPELRNALADQGFEFVNRSYLWPQLIERYRLFLQATTESAD